jgi:hypothetical protein
MPTDGCQTEGCQTDQGNETYYYVKYLEEHGNEGLAQLTTYWYNVTMANLATRGPGDGPPTAADDPFRLTLEAVNTDARDNAVRYGLTPGGTLTAKNLVNDIITLGVIFGGGGYIQGRLNGNYAFGQQLSATRWQQGVRDDLGSRMPGSWGDGMPNRDGTGWRWLDPNNPSGNGVRIDRGDPLNPNLSQQVDHVVVRYNGRLVGPDGSLLPASARLKDYPQAHIPRSVYQTWSTWYAP